MLHSLIKNPCFVINAFTKLKDVLKRDWAVHSIVIISLWSIIISFFLSPAIETVTNIAQKIKTLLFEELAWLFEAPLKLTCLFFFTIQISLFCWPYTSLPRKFNSGSWYPRFWLHDKLIFYCIIPNHYRYWNVICIATTR